jgi:hypothetical protein
VLFVIENKKFTFETERREERDAEKTTEDTVKKKVKKCTARKGIRETHKRGEMRRRKSTSSLHF